MHKMIEIAKYLPKLEMLASSLTSTQQERAPPKKRVVKNVSHKLTKQKVALVKKRVLQPSLPDLSAIPRFGQPGMVYVPASWVQKNPVKRSKRRTAFYKRSTAVEQNALLQSPVGTSKKRAGTLVQRKVVLKTTTLADTKKAALALERKRLDFLKYLQDVQDDISALQFPLTEGPKKRTVKSKKRITAVSKMKKKRTEDTKKTKANAKSPGTTQAKAKPNVEYLKNEEDQVLSSASASKQSISSMLSEESSSSTQIKIIDDAFSNNYKRER